ncbi:hypothetical protein NDU88_002318 [Pleurodeles waltl]|uniref:Uncharacterized protein n=1 Tax=Pleurodeles waltl TaxID=8319 RepID=A0AAV7MME2_PLEWA|nr:hypothetical protein NDU88_002318 [Pleurodeles waltl]
MRGVPRVRTSAAPEERRLRTKARRDRERWSVSRALRRRAAPETNLGHCAMRRGGHPLPSKVEIGLLEKIRNGALGATEYAGLDIVWQGPGGRWFRRGAPLLAHLTRRDRNIKEYD